MNEPIGKQGVHKAQKGYAFQHKKVVAGQTGPQTRMMEDDISEHNVIKLKYHRKKKTVQAIFPLSACELMTAIKKIHYYYKCYRVTEGRCYTVYLQPLALHPIIRRVGQPGACGFKMTTVHLNRWVACSNVPMLQF